MTYKNTIVFSLAFLLMSCNRLQIEEWSLIRSSDENTEYFKIILNNNKIQYLYEWGLSEEKPTINSENIYYSNNLEYKIIRSSTNNISITTFFLAP